MKAKIERNWLNQSVKVWLYYNGPPTRLLRVVGPGLVPAVETLAPGVESVEPSLELPEEALAALVTEASGILPASDATTAHLADAVAVRDRLLALVEKRR